MEKVKKVTKKSLGFTKDEQAAMKARVKEMRAEARANQDRAEGEKTLLAAIAAMKEPDRTIAKKLHAIISANAPGLLPKTWYGMPAYANKDGKAVCYFRDRLKFKERYAMFGFNDSAKLDDGLMWPVAFALKDLTATEEKKIIQLLKTALG